MHSRPQPKRFGWIIGHTEGICCFRVARRVGMGWGGRSSGSRRRSFSCTLVAALRASAAIARLPIPQRARSERESDPARGCRTAIVRPGVEGDGGLGRGAMDGVDHRFKQNQPTRWQADTCANHHAVVDVTGKAAFNCRDRGLVGVDEADLGMPAPPRR